MPSDFMFHIRNAHPGDMAALLATLDGVSPLDTVGAIVNEAEMLGFSIRDRQRLEALATARDLGFVSEGNALLPRGRALSQIELRKPQLFADIVHALQYALWEDKDRGANCFSWSYRTICQLLWDSGSMVVSDRRNIASNIESQARDTFGHDDIAFSPKSVGGALLWLTELDPAVISEDGSRFSRRPFCPPELFVLAVDFVYRSMGMDYRANLLLTDTRRDEICRMCLLDREGFDRVLSYAEAQFECLGSGLGGGWGQYLVLQARPQIEELFG